MSHPETKTDWVLSLLFRPKSVSEAFMSLVGITIALGVAVLLFPLLPLFVLLWALQKVRGEPPETDGEVAHAA
ncbi:DUF7535 family protein [Halospeciosus flavus]|uniref:Uncharacterized protein n=1 Tax=Halospeciosus flavus TaxID=3032283 RepID=A0ABD5Z7I2_9EURY|nr:hypothetical protein [Halospeciosus flavus]